MLMGDDTFLKPCYNSSFTWVSRWASLVTVLFTWKRDVGLGLSLRISSGRTQALLRRGMCLKSLWTTSFFKIICLIYFSPLHNYIQITVHYEAAVHCTMFSYLLSWLFDNLFGCCSAPSELRFCIRPDDVIFQNHLCLDLPRTFLVLRVENVLEASLLGWWDE
jgi:hypothetical protein